MAGDGRISFELGGLDRLNASLEAIASSTPEACARALYQEALVEQKESMRRTPVEFGPLRASHETNEPEIRGRDISVRIFVGGPAAPYAMHVHENLEADHPVGQAKFLESTISESAPFMAQRVGARLRIGQP